MLHAHYQSLQSPWEFGQGCLVQPQPCTLHHSPRASILRAEGIRHRAQIYFGQPVLAKNFWIFPNPANIFAHSETLNTCSACQPSLHWSQGGICSWCAAEMCMFWVFLQLEQKVISRFLTWVAEIYLPVLAGYKAKSKRCSHVCNHRVMSLHCYSLWIKELLSCVNLCWGIISSLHSKHALPMFCWMQWQKLAVTITQADQIGFFHLSLGVAVML